MTDRGRDLDLHGMMDVLWLAETVRDRHGARRPAAGPAFPPAADAAGAAPPDGPGQLDDQGESSFTPPIGTPAPDGELLRQRHGPQLSEAGAGMTAARGTVDDRIGAAGRALRPLRRTVPRPGGEELDEDRTVRVSADADLPVVITRTRTERWLDLALVLDVSPSMGLWRDTVAETTRALERAGVFRDVRVWRLFPGADGALVLHTPAGQRRRPTELLDYSGRRLIAVLTDGIDDRWRRESTVAFLRKWATHNPIVILQPLPPSMWHRTSLPPIPMRARQRVPGIWRHPSPDPRHPVDEGWVPVVGGARRSGPPAFDAGRAARPAAVGGPW